MNPPIQACIIFDERSHHGAFRLHRWHRYRFWMALRTCLGIAVFPLALWLVVSEGWTPWPMLLMMVGTLVLLRPAIWNMMQTRSLQKLPGYGQKVCYTISPEEVEIDGESQTARIGPEQILECVSGKMGILIYHGKTSYTWIPRSAFTNEKDFEIACKWLGDMAG